MSVDPGVFLLGMTIMLALSLWLLMVCYKSPLWNRLQTKGAGDTCVEQQIQDHLLQGRIKSMMIVLKAWKYFPLLLHAPTFADSLPEQAIKETNEVQNMEH